MPRGHSPKRESKKPRKKDSRKAVEPLLPAITSTEVEVVRKRKKSKEEEEV